MSHLPIILQEIADRDILRIIEQHSTSGRFGVLSGPAFIALLSLWKASGCKPDRYVNPASIEWLHEGIHSTLGAARGSAARGSAVWWPALCASGAIDPRIADGLHQFSAVVEFVLTGQHDQSRPADLGSPRVRPHHLNRKNGLEIAFTSPDVVAHDHITRNRRPRHPPNDRKPFSQAEQVQPPSQIFRLPPRI